jgi:hypothetical protein
MSAPPASAAHPASISGFVWLFLGFGIPFMLGWAFQPQIARALRSFAEAWRFTGQCRKRPPYLPGSPGPQDGQGCLSYDEEGTWNEMRARLEAAHDDRGRP